MQKINQISQKKSRPVKVLQFGEGNFLRAFADQMIDVANKKDLFNGNIQIIKSIPHGSLKPLIEQDYVYTVILRGIKDGSTYVEKHIVESIEGATASYEDYTEYAKFAKSEDLRFIISNTTEAGIVYDDTDRFELEPPNSYPGKLTKLLYERFVFYSGAKEKGLIILPVELIEKNGEKLLECCKLMAENWNLPQTFLDWLFSSNIFCNTLVDRIVTGYPGEEAQSLEKELGYTDKLLVVGEPFALWVIENKNEVVAEEFPLDKAGLPVVFTDNLQPYRERKVRILNGGHTATVAAAYLSGLDTVGEMMKDETIRSFLETVVYKELAPRVPLPESEVKLFADSVMERFENPFIKHNLLSITLNSVSKFRTRVLPTIFETVEETGVLPKHLCFSLAALVELYCVGERDGVPYEIIDDEDVLNFFSEHKSDELHDLVSKLLSRNDFWGEDLTKVSELLKTITSNLQSIRKYGMRKAIEMV